MGLIVIRPTGAGRQIYAGNGSLDALRFFENCQQAVIVDAMQPAQHPGQIVQFDARLVSQSSCSQRLLSMHALSIPELLQTMANSHGQWPDKIEVFAIEAQNIAAFEPGLTEVVANRIDELADRIEHYLNELSVYASHAAARHLSSN